MALKQSNRIWIFLVMHLLFVSSATLAQHFQLPGSPLLGHLYHSKDNFSHIGFINGEPFSPYYKETDQKFIHHLMKNRNGLFMTINGTGQVFKVTDATQSYTSIVRVDSTVFWGNNFHSFDFSFKDTIFSIGGYGFWRYNGHLRYFKNGGEWYLVPLGEEHAMNSKLVHLDTLAGKLYFIQMPFVDDATLKANEGNLVFEVDLIKRSVQQLGKLNFPIKGNANLTHFSSPLLNGLMLLQDKVWYLLSFTDNKIHVLDNPAKTDWFYSGAKHFPQAYFQSGDSLYMYANIEDSLRSTSISMKDFHFTGQQLFIAESLWSPAVIIGLVTCLIVLGSLFAFFQYRRKSTKGKSQPESIYTSEVATLQYSDSFSFSELELSIVNALISKEANGMTLSVEELNKIMGLGKKSNEVQKKTRRDAIIKINQKFIVQTGVRTELIESRRSDDDKRYFQYFIAPEKASQFRKLLAL